MEIALPIIAVALLVAGLTIAFQKEPSQKLVVSASVTTVIFLITILIKEFTL
ncbi:MAG: hypothetical protein KAJ75_02255 [Alphaproteobacteria bacterium]|nr:hypothetical protein [Alphaproteobacteria bacterium]